MTDVLPPRLSAAISDPNLGALTSRYAGFERTLRTSHARDARRAVFDEWDGVRRELSTWAHLVQLRFDRDTTNPEARAARERRDELEPKLIALDHRLKERFVADGGELRPVLGDQAFRLWENDLAAFAPAIEDDLVAESTLEAAYAACVAAIRVTYRGETYNLAGMAPFGSDPNRDVRHETAALRWAALGERGAELDRIYDELVHVRARIARTLGYRNFVELGYRRMQRIGYGSEEVARWRETIRTHVTPFVAALAERAARLHGTDRIAVWDERLILGPEPAVALGDGTWMLDRARETFGAMHPELGAFAEMMQRDGLTDLMTRAGKAGGGHCTFLATPAVPFIFANLSGDRSDVATLVHEFGHAFQVYSSRMQPAYDYVWPTHEGAEIHSMGLEFLAWGEMERFFGAGASAYRSLHLADRLLLLPYAAAVDHFQHLVYERPEATPAERHAMWQGLERRYLPWRFYGDLERPASGAFWQSQLHIYKVPFYYIDYTLAQCVAFQLWDLAANDPAEALNRYLRLCRLGGSANFGDLVTSAGLQSPFTSNALARTVARASEILRVA
jgi:M3 family oligoendopeptidase